MFTPNQFDANSLRAHPPAARVIASAFNAVHAGEAVKKYLRENPIPSAKHIYAFGLGKAACAMTSALADLIPLTDTLIVTKYAANAPQSAAVILGNHPIPDEASLTAGRAALNFVSQLTPDDLLVCLISGGGSALMTAPVIPLNELQRLTSALLANGARIDQINILRRHLDLLKGGGLAQAANGAKIISLILSDVVGDSLEAIASGPTAPDPTTIADAQNVTQVSSLRHAMRETLKPNHPIFENVENHIIASNDIALRAAKDQAEAEGFYTEIINSGLQGEAREVGKYLAGRLKEADKKYPRPFCLLAGGEMTVTLNGDGKGGRNQELALSAVNDLRDMKNVMLISIATDGEDGPTDAAGAVATENSAWRAESMGMSAENSLSRNDAYPFFDQLGDLIKPGASGTNVNDIVFIFAF
ncbi:MAG: DUF4147 domain-containing protein [Anaerolineales bacterium]|nr:DUF4147 domain-containing protein [Anaerolineales bacterium]